VRTCRAVFPADHPSALRIATQIPRQKFPFPSPDSSPRTAASKAIQARVVNAISTRSCFGPYHRAADVRKGRFRPLFLHWPGEECSVSILRVISSVFPTHPASDTRICGLKRQPSVRRPTLPRSLPASYGRRLCLPKWPAAEDVRKICLSISHVKNGRARNCAAPDKTPVAQAPGRCRFDHGVPLFGRISTITGF
jgi:hypothetical protein